MSNQVKETKVITGVVRLSYANIWDPVAIGDSQDKKFSVSLLIPKTDKKTISDLKKAIEAAKEAGKAKFGGKIPPKLKLPLRDGDEERPDDEVYAGHYFVNATSKTRPGIVDKNKHEVLDPEEVASGDYARVSVNFYAFDSNGNRGIACGLNNIMKVRDGERLGGRSRAEDDFAEIEVEDDDDLLG